MILVTTLVLMVNSVADFRGCCQSKRFWTCGGWAICPNSLVVRDVPVSCPGSIASDRNSDSNLCDLASDIIMGILDPRIRLSLSGVVGQLSEYES